MDESFHTRDNQDFLSWLAERRALDTLPFVVLLLGPHVGRRRLELRSATQGPVGLLVRRCVLASTDELLAKFADNLWTRQAFSVRFSPATLSTITRSYREQSKSAVYVMLKLKDALAHSFIPRGSFGGLSCSLPFVSTFLRCVVPYARSKSRAIPSLKKVYLPDRVGTNLLSMK
jgi:hypothetical protein